MIRPLAIVIAVALVVIVAGSCSSGTETPAGEDARVATETPPDPTVTPTETGSEVLRVLIASTDLAVGRNRLVFAILDEESSPLRIPEVRFTLTYLDASPPEVRSQGSALFRPWPANPGGVYAAAVSFDDPGRWGLEVRIPGDGGVLVGRAGVVVNRESSSPAIGRPVPASRNKTLKDADISELTTSAVPDLDLYRTTIAEAISGGLPTLVTFATPAFCTSATCGPQVEVVSTIKERYKGRANFIHIEVYDNPHEMEGDLSKGRLSPLLDEWGLRSEPFTFVIDADGLVAAKFEGFATEDELESALREVITS